MENTTKMYCFKFEDGTVLGFDTCKGSDGKEVLGAYLPGIDGNYYKELIIGVVEPKGPHHSSFDEYLDYLKDAVVKEYIEASEEFPFSFDDLSIRFFEL